MNWFKQILHLMLALGERSLEIYRATGVHAHFCYQYQTFKTPTSSFAIVTCDESISLFFDQLEQSCFVSFPP